MFDWKEFFWRTWETNRHLTLKVAQRFPPNQLMSATPVPTMRPFGDMLVEIAGLEHYLMHGLAEGVWEWGTQPETADAAGVFALLDKTRAYTRQVWPDVPESKLITVHPAPPSFAGPSAPPLDWLQYALENEIHHRAQGYTYLRHLGIEPHAFWDRG